MGELLQRQLVTVRVRIAMVTSFPIVGSQSVTSPTPRSIHQDHSVAKGWRPPSVTEPGLQSGCYGQGVSHTASSWFTTFSSTVCSLFVHEGLLFFCLIFKRFLFIALFTIVWRFTIKRRVFSAGNLG